MESITTILIVSLSIGIFALIFILIYFKNALNYETERNIQLAKTIKRQRNILEKLYEKPKIHHEFLEIKLKNGQYVCVNYIDIIAEQIGDFKFLKIKAIKSDVECTISIRVDEILYINYFKSKEDYDKTVPV